MEKGSVLPKNIRQIGEINGREKVCIEDYAMTWIHKREQQEDKGYLGIFFGEQQETEDSVYVFIRGIFEVPTEIQEPQQREEIRKEYEKYFGGWTVQGCCVIGAYPTERMKALGAWIPETGKLIYHLQDQEETLYWTGEEQYRRLHGYFVFYEQNKKMQEYLADLFKDSSVEKESAPDRAIRSFREKVKEKGEQKQAGFLRMASSFFVITVLIIGAIVVNRVEDIRSVRSLSVAGDTPTYQSLPEQADDQDAAAEAVSSTTTQTASMSGGSTAQDAAAMSAAQYNALQQAAEEAELAGSDAFWEKSDLEDSAEQQKESETEEGSPASDAVQAAVGDSAPDASQETVGDSVSDASQAATGDSAPDASQETVGDSVSDASQENAEDSAPDASQETVGDSVSDASQETAGDSMSGASQETAGDSVSGASDASEADTAQDAQEAAAIRNTQAGYVIREGDTLAKICSRYYGSIDRIAEVCEANGIEDANVILPGQRIVLP